MAKPRRAVRRRVSGRVLLSSALIGVTAMATLAVWQMSDTEASVALPAAEEKAVTESVSLPSPSESAGESASESAGESTSPDAGSDAGSDTATTKPSASPSLRAVDWSSVVTSCKRKVASRDAVIARAATGVDHWSQHVQAQTDANAGRISVAAMKKSFMRTRLLGPADIGRYRGALDAAAAQSGGCATPKDAPGDVKATLGSCAARLAAQKPVLGAGARGMNDWSSHLAAMKRSKGGHVHNAQQVWVAAWRAAPPNITSFEKASARFRSAAAC